MPLVQEASAAKFEGSPVLDDGGNFLPPAFQEGAEIKGHIPPVLNDGEFMPFKEGSEIKFDSPVLQGGKFLPPGLV
jgi:hypothetical protein